jgi:hypothetical protein
MTALNQAIVLLLGTMLITAAFASPSLKAGSPQLKYLGRVSLDKGSGSASMSWSMTGAAATIVLQGPPTDHESATEGVYTCEVCCIGSLSRT